MKSVTLTKIIIADSQPVLCEGLKLLLTKRSSLEVTAAFNSGTEIFLNQPLLADCDIIIHDIYLPGLDGFGILRNIGANYPNIACLVYTPFRLPEFFRQSIALGARGYIYKRDKVEILLQAIDNIRAGKLGISPKISPMMLNGKPTPSPGSVLDILTDREKEVLALIAGGATSREIASVLGVKKSTIDKHRENIRSKLGRKGLHEAIILAAKNGVV